MSFQNSHVPGFRAARWSGVSQIYRAGIDGETQITQNAVILDGDAVDSGNTPTTTLRGGCIILKRDSDGKGIKYATGTAGVIAGILPAHQTMLDDQGGLTVDKWVPLFTGGLIREDELVDSNHYLLARLHAMGFKFTDPQLTASVNAFTPILQETPVTLTEADHGRLYESTVDVTITLPATPSEGLSYEFRTLTTTGGKTITLDGASNIMGATALTNDTLTLGTGGHIRVTAMPIGGLKWVVSSYGIAQPTIS